MRGVTGNSSAANQCVRKCAAIAGRAYVGRFCSNEAQQTPQTVRPVRCNANHPCPTYGVSTFAVHVKCRHSTAVSLHKPVKEARCYRREENSSKKGAVTPHGSVLAAAAASCVRQRRCWRGSKRWQQIQYARRRCRYAGGRGGSAAVASGSGSDERANEDIRSARKRPPAMAAANGSDRAPPAVQP